MSGVPASAAGWTTVRWNGASRQASFARSLDVFDGFDAIASDGDEERSLWLLVRGKPVDQFSVPVLEEAYPLKSQACPERQSVRKPRLVLPTIGNRVNLAVSTRF